MIGGPDMWEVIAAARSAPEHGGNLAHVLAGRIGLPVEKIRIATSYYSEYPDEVDQFIAANEQEAEQLARARDRTPLARMKLLLDEMYAPTIVERLRARGHDVTSVHDAAIAHSKVSRIRPPKTIGRLVTALDALLAAEPDPVTALFLKPA